MSLQLTTSSRPLRSSTFGTTSWTIILKAQKSDPVDARPAMEQLCGTYWYPVYAFARRSNLRATDAEDATQAFFAWLVESNVLERADPDRGRFRSFLIAAFKQFLSRRRDYERAAKRKPDQSIVSIHACEGEQRYALEPCHDRTPERVFEYTWALTQIEQAMHALRTEWVKSGKGDRFDVLKPYLTRQQNEQTQELSRKLGMSEGAVRVAIHRLRRRFGELLREEIGRTLGAGHDVDEELRQMKDALKL